MTAVYQTPDTDTLVFDDNVYQRMKFADGVSVFTSPTESFQVVRFAKDERILDYALTQFQLPESQQKPYELMVFKEEYLNNPVKIRLEIESPKDQEIMISADSAHPAQLREGRYWYEIKTAEPVAEYYITSKDSDILFYGFEITTLDQTE
jgi:hypothetical protein